MARQRITHGGTNLAIATLPLVAFLVLVLVLHEQRQRSTEAFIAHTQAEQATLLSAITRLHQAGIEAYFRKFVAGEPEVIDLLSAIGDSDDRAALRNDLYARMRPVMAQLTLTGVDIFTFRLPDHETFLRVHLPNAHSDPLEIERRLIREAARTGLPRHGFEAGRLAPAYRSILPIHHPDGSLLATLDIGIPMRRLLEELRSTLPGREVFVILPQSEQLLASLDAGEWPYARWAGSDDFFIDLPSSDPVATEPGTGEQSSALLQQWRHDNRVQAKLRSLTPGSLIVDAGNGSLLTQTPILDSRGQTMALLVSHRTEPGLSLLKNQFWSYLGAGLVVIAVLTFVSLKLARSTREKLAERERLVTIAQSLGSGLLVTDSKGRIQSANQRACELLAIDPDQWTGRSASTLFGLAPNRDANLLSAFTGRSECRTELVYTRPDRSECIFRIDAVPLRGGTDGQGAVSLLEDVTRARQSEKQLQLAGTVFGEAREGIIITDARTRILDVNLAFTRITGYSREEALGQRPSLLQSGVQDEDFYKAMWNRLREHGSWQGEMWNRRKNGELYPETLSISAVESKHGEVTHYVAMFSDISQEKIQERELRRIALYDSLTGMPNRVLLATQLEQAMNAALENRSVLALAIVDLDGFKQVNDEHGREIGDGLLIDVAGRLRSTLRKSDPIGRLGGDEFALVLTDLARSDSAPELLGEVLRAIAEPALIENQRLRISASIGFTLFPQTGEVDAEQLLRQADQAMYRAKVAGKQRIHEFNVTEDSAVRGRMEQIDQLRRALHEEQFVLHYQPKVNLQTGEVFGAEALLRWQHPEEGLIPPGRFLPMLAGDPLEIDVGRWVLESALAQAEAWHRSGLPLEVSINIAGQHLQEASFCEELSEGLAAHPQLPPSSVQLEIVESSALADIDRVSEVMARCASVGVQFALDDFGTGYSSLTYLKRLPAETLKIDQSFVRDMRHDPDDLAILDGILTLAQAFDRQSIAEGVETAEDGELLIQFGCSRAQGYGIARPMPAEQIPGWAQQWQPYPAWMQARPASRAGREFLYAIVEHRGWIASLRDYLNGARREPPSHDPERCRLGLRLSPRLRTRLEPGLQASIDEAHARLHELANELIDHQADDDQPTLLTGPEELEVQSDRLIAHLQTAAQQQT